MKSAGLAGEKAIATIRRDKANLANVVQYTFKLGIKSSTTTYAAPAKAPRTNANETACVS